MWRCVKELELTSQLPPKTVFNVLPQEDPAELVNQFKTAEGASHLRTRTRMMLTGTVLVG